MKSQVKTQVISRKEFNTILNALAKAGWEQTASVMDDSGTGGLYFRKGEETFCWNSKNDDQTRKLAGIIEG